MEVEMFCTAAEAMERLTQAIKAADARVHPWQAAVKPGDCFIMDSCEGFLVFGEVLEGNTEKRLRHYRFCRCHLEACPEGELGDVHVSVIRCVITRKFFEEMRQEGWRV